MDENVEKSVPREDEKKEAAEGKMGQNGLPSGEILSLKEGESIVKVDSFGAYVTQFTVGQTDILLPRTALWYDGEWKYRGGIPLCAPQFSKGGFSGLPMHGYARDIPWRTISRTESHLLLEAEAVEGEYQKLQSRMEIELKGRTLSLTLFLQNQGEEELPVAPAFHPYFKMLPEEDILVDGVCYQWGDTRLPSDILLEKVSTLKTEHYTLKLRTENLFYYNLWTDWRSDYFCAEPTHSGTSFVRGEGYLVLRPGEEARFAFKITAE